jgi:hypothetical protein
MSQRRAVDRLFGALGGVIKEAAALYRITAHFVIETIARQEAVRRASEAQDATSQESESKKRQLKDADQREYPKNKSTCPDATEESGHGTQSIQGPAAGYETINNAPSIEDYPPRKILSEGIHSHGIAKNKNLELSAGRAWSDNRVRASFRKQLVDVLQDWELNALVSTSTTHDLLNTAQMILSQLAEEGTGIAEKAAQSLIDALKDLGIDSVYLDIDSKAVSASENPIEEFALVRQISHLVHFTRVENVPSIAKEGILSNKQLTAMGRAVLDQNRYDGRSDHVCMSISFPNYQMLFRYSQGNASDWCVIAVQPSVMWTRECLFYPYNAATGDLAVRPSCEFLGVSALRQMFADSVCSRNRHACLPENHTTSPQAEILVPGAISPGEIISVEFSTAANADKFRGVLESVSIPSRCSERLFEPRCDWDLWRKS